MLFGNDIIGVHTLDLCAVASHQSSKYVAIMKELITISIYFILIDNGHVTSKSVNSFRHCDSVEVLKSLIVCRPLPGIVQPA